MQKHADYLGALGLIPFLGLPMLVVLQQMSLYEAQGLFIYYGAVILSFLGGIHWYDAHNRSQSVTQLYFAMLPSIVAWIAIGFTFGLWSMVMLSISFGIVLIYDFVHLKMTSLYQRQRVVLTGIVIGCHLFMIWLSV